MKKEYLFMKFIIETNDEDYEIVKMGQHFTSESLAYSVRSDVQYYINQLSRDAYEDLMSLLGVPDEDVDWKDVIHVGVDIESYTEDDFTPEELSELTDEIKEDSDSYILYRLQEWVEDEED